MASAAITMSSRRFSPPSRSRILDACFVVRNRGQKLATHQLTKCNVSFSNCSAEMSDHPTTGDDLWQKQTEDFAMRSPIFIALVLAATLGPTLIGKAFAAPVNGMAAISHQVTNEVQ